MAIQKRLLAKLKSANAALDMLQKGKPLDINDLLQRLTDAQSLCQKGLPEAAYKKYEEIYDGLIMAIKEIQSGEAAGDAQAIIALCMELLQHIVVETIKEDKFKKEIFFLPYKASMWDSLESVWKAADEDKENCIAYVMPIPYCDRNPDGTAREWHCERYEFPEYVPTLDWQSVDLKAWHPEVIFYHNPYDNNNRVTSVEGTYYSSNLKECADKLIYIPYFVLAEPNFDYDDPEKKKEIQETENKIANFVLEPGVINADYTIVQSEAMKQVYVKILARHTNATKEYWEKRILGLGSPKFDKVFGSKKEDYQIPEEWERLIAGRKTIFYNTGLSAMLDHRKKFVEKVRSVIETFKKQNDVLLWWRPHPLLISTFRSMHPELLAEYEEIVNTYRSEKWGIYDDTPDMDRAIECTDGYYGDWSSLVHLYEKTGKKVFIQNCRAGKNLFSGISHFMDSVEKDGYMYFSENSFNGLFRYRVGETKAEFLGSFPGEEPWQGDLHRNVFVKGDKLFFIPINGHGISVYDCRNSKFNLLKIPGGDDEYVHYMQCIEVDEKLMLIPVNLNTPFAFFDLKNEKIDYIEKVSKEIAGMISHPTRYEIFSLYGAINVDGFLYLALCPTNIILKISLRTFAVEKIELPIHIRLRYINYVDGWFYFTGMNHVIGRWCETDNTGDIYDIPYEATDEVVPYIQLIPYQDKLILPSGREDRFWMFSPSSNKWENLTYNFPPGFERDIRGSLLFLGYREDGENLYLYPRAGNGLLRFNAKEKKFYFEAIRYSSELLNSLGKNIINHVLDENRITFEAVVSIEDYLEYMKTFDLKAEDELEERLIGEYIYQLIKEGV
ncbi:hypothetical protein [Selenomonas ruminantium]|uniref:CDP-Glycerol:Poly(Glycerophosphate) glycerophosphotransferase n=1 Tax=Selenomonas ruminantium TaxID=971 RepID=A0A1H0S0I0_SELRU|nr:hypothetical protein [Selenomonas ruminantium]SDP35193.1 hypothetical protein SAMN05216366_1153 [Selenomonas ruminantium]